MTAIDGEIDSWLERSRAARRCDRCGDAHEALVNRSCRLVGDYACKLCDQCLNEWATFLVGVPEYAGFMVHDTEWQSYAAAGRTEDAVSARVRRTDAERALFEIGRNWIAAGRKVQP